MGNTPTSSKGEKALGKSISFSPGSLFADAVKFGEAQTPKLNQSEVVCLALAELFKRRKFATVTDTNEIADAEILACADEVGRTVAIKALRNAARRGGK